MQTSGRTPVKKSPAGSLALWMFASIYCTFLRGPGRCCRSVREQINLLRCRCQRREPAGRAEQYLGGCINHGRRPSQVSLSMYLGWPCHKDHCFVVKDRDSPKLLCFSGTANTYGMGTFVIPKLYLTLSAASCLARNTGSPPFDIVNAPQP